MAGAVDEIQNGFHCRGSFADNDGAADRFFGIRRRGDQLRHDVFGHPRLSDGEEIPDAIEVGIKGRVREQLGAGAEKFLIRDHAFAGGNGEPSLRVDGNVDRHGMEKLATFVLLPTCLFPVALRGRAKRYPDFWYRVMATTVQCATAELNVGTKRVIGGTGSAEVRG